MSLLTFVETRPTAPKLVLPPPRPAKMGYRMLAFALDSVLAIALAVLLCLRVLLPSLGGEAEGEFWAFVHSYERAAEAVQEGVANEDAMQMLVVGESVEQTASRFFFFSLMVLCAYFFLSEWLMRGETLGKRICRMRTVHLTHRRPPNRMEALVRGCMKGISLAVIFFLPGVFGGNIYAILIALLAVDYVIAFYNPMRRTLHDMAANTLVVEPNPTTLLDEIA